MSHEEEQACIDLAVGAGIIALDRFRAERSAALAVCDAKAREELLVRAVLTHLVAWGLVEVVPPAGPESWRPVEIDDRYTRVLDWLLEEALRSPLQARVQNAGGPVQGRAGG